MRELPLPKAAADSYSRGRRWAWHPGRAWSARGLRRPRKANSVDGTLLS
jgi:hypothetical protein